MIDHMERIIRGDMNSNNNAAQKSAAQPTKPSAGASRPSDSGLLGDQDAAMLNFQRASCTLDASIKIWSCRVDDVWSSSYRVLENLSRGGNGNAGGEEDKGGEAGADARGSGDSDDEKENAAPGGGSSRARRGAASGTGSATLERNLASITLKRIDTGLEVDPMFHKLSAAFDEGGAGGMLLNRLAVHDSCDIAFDSTEACDVDGTRGAGYVLPTAAALLADAPVGCLPEDDSAALRNLLLQRLPEVGAEVPASAGGDPLAMDAAGLLSALRSLTLSPSLQTLYDSMRVFAAAVGDTAVSALLPPEDGKSSSATAALPSAAAAAAAARRLSSVADKHKRGAAAAADEEEAEGGDEDDDGWAAVAKLNETIASHAGDMLDGGDGGGAAMLLPAVELSVIDEALVGTAAAAAAAGGGGDDDYDGGAWFGAGDDEDAEVDTGSGGGSAGGDAAWSAAIAAAGPGGLARAAAAAPVVGAASEYTFVNVNALAAASGGAEKTGHWKFKTAATRAAVAAKGKDGADAAAESAESAKGKKGAAKRKAGKAGAGGLIDFSAAGKPASDAFAKAKAVATSRNKGAAPRDSEQMTAAAIDKLTRAGPLAFVMPHAAGCDPITLRPLRNTALPSVMQLNLKPQITMSARTSSGAGAQADGEEEEEDAGAGGAAAILFAPARVLGGGANSGSGAGGYGGDTGGDDDDDVGGYDNGFDVESYAAAAEASAAASAAEGGAGSGGGAGGAAWPTGPVELVPAGRKVEKIRVRYETVAKRVDVRALKEDMWALLEEPEGGSSGSSGGAGSGPAPPVLPLRHIKHKAFEAETRKAANEAEEQFTDVSGSSNAAAPAAAAAVDAAAGGTFTQAIKHLAPQMSSQVTVPFYFITLLHLANEHGLVLRGQPGLGDFEIARLE